MMLTGVEKHHCLYRTVPQAAVFAYVKQRSLKRSCMPIFASCLSGVFRYMHGPEIQVVPSMLEVSLLFLGMVLPVGFAIGQRCRLGKCQCLDLATTRAS
jgi:hypothetical protein